MTPSATALELWQQALDLLKESNLDSKIEALLDVQEKLRLRLQQELSDRGIPTSLSNLNAYLKAMRDTKKEAVDDFLLEYPDRDELLNSLFFYLLGECVSLESNPALGEEEGFDEVDLSPLSESDIGDFQESYTDPSREKEIRGFYRYSSEILLRLHYVKHGDAAERVPANFKNLLKSMQEQIEIISIKKPHIISGIKKFNQHAQAIINEAENLDGPGASTWLGWKEVNSKTVSAWERELNPAVQLSLRSENLTLLTGRPNWYDVIIDEQTQFENFPKRMSEIIVDNFKNHDATDIIKYYITETGMEHRKLITGEFVLHCLSEINRSSAPLSQKKQQAIAVVEYCAPRVSQTTDLLVISAAILNMESPQQHLPNHHDVKFIREETGFYKSLKSVLSCFLCCLCINPQYGNTQTWSTILGVIKESLNEINSGASRRQLRGMDHYSLYYNTMNRHRDRQIHFFPTQHAEYLPEPMSQHAVQCRA